MKIIMTTIEKNKRILTIGGVVFLFTLSTLFIIEKFRFPIEYIICDSGYSDCSVFAKFPDMRSCQNESKKGNWLCDERSPQDIRCRASTDSTVVSYCKD